MGTCVTLSEMPSFKVKIKFPLWLLVGYWLVTPYNQTFPSISSKQSSVLHRMAMIGNAHCSQFME